MPKSIDDRYDAAKQVAGMMNEILGGNFFLEIQFHGMSEERCIAKDILRLSKELNISCSRNKRFHLTIFTSIRQRLRKCLCACQRKTV